MKTARASFADRGGRPPPKSPFIHRSICLVVPETVVIPGGSHCVAHLQNLTRDLLDPQVSLMVMLEGVVTKHHILIGDVAARGGVQPEAVRYYERRGLLPRPERAPNGYRIYSAAHLDRIDFIKRAQGLGLSLDEIRDVLELRDKASQDSCQHVEELLEGKIAKVELQIEELKKYRKDLLQSLRGCKKSLQRHAEDALCPVIEQWNS